ncbi:site-specific DNA-methyltransferase [Sphingobium sp. JS3065]|uniref:site-specific DNA-methyltransferase n=1 Tax=Sphingobium sp. JS3065 TaxID=2970925 RepID=UPI002264A446|nr:site-specific DNA-methyltransferase [Sphingobium sp. JS3065]UZW54034.1 site-specific DNA-methyltransferase [Sphingobium sp. JS3065]
MTDANGAALAMASSANALSLPAAPTAVIIGAATLYLGDCYEILPRLGWVPNLVTDPPYEFETSGGGRFRAARGHTDQIEAEGLADGFDHEIINPLLCGSVVVFCHNDQIPDLTAYLAGSFSRFVICSWIKSNPMPVANKHYQPDTEFYIHAWNRDYHPHGELADKRRQIIAPVGRAKDFSHPTVKPDAVMDKIITNCAPGLICDPFMGTGSTGVAAVKASRPFIGIEKNPKHFATACARLAAAQGLERAA